jgi:hypothetical protein
MTPAASAQIAVGRLFDSTHDAIVIGNPDGGPRGSGFRAGQVSIWKNIDSMHISPDVIVTGDTSGMPMSRLGLALAVGDFDGDGRQDLCVESGNYLLTSGGSIMGMHVFWGGGDFPARHSEWMDQPKDKSWHYNNVFPFSFSHSSFGRSYIGISTYMFGDTVWGGVRKGSRLFVYGVREIGVPFDTIPIDIWRPPDTPDRICLDGLSPFGDFMTDIGSVGGRGTEAMIIGGSHSFGGSGGVVLYMSGKDFDTIPDAFFEGGSISVGGIDWNNDSIGDIVIPRPNAAGFDKPKGVVEIVSGSRAFRSFGVDAVREAMRLSSPFIAVFPQPVRDDLTVSIAGDGTMNHAPIVVTDALGREVIRSDARGSDSHLSVDNLPAGIYHIRAFINKQLFTRSFIHVR